MNVLLKSVSNLLIFNSKELSPMSFILKGKQAILLTIFLTGISPVAAIEQSVKQSVKDQKIFMAGTDLSGGGTSVKIMNTNGTASRVLLDFYNFGKIPQTSSAAILLPKTEALKKLGIERLEIEKTPFYSDLQKQFQFWKLKSPLFVKYLEQASRNISIYYTTYQISKLDKNTYFTDQKFLESLEPRSVAFYAKGFGILVSLRDFEQLSYENQKGLILHEIVRHLQIGYGFKMKDKMVQFLVNALLTSETTSTVSLDSAEYFGTQKWSDLTQGNDPAVVQSIFKEAAELIAKYSKNKIEIDIKDIGKPIEISNKAQILRMTLGNIGSSVLYPELERCRQLVNKLANNCYEKAARDLDKADLLIAQLRNISLTAILQEFNAIEDDVKDRTLLLNNARQLDLQIDCANNRECTDESLKNRLSGPFVEFLKSGDINE